MLKGGGQMRREPFIKNAKTVLVSTFDFGFWILDFGLVVGRRQSRHPHSALEKPIFALFCEMRETETAFRAS
jgi:hypothetical protein